MNASRVILILLLVGSGSVSRSQVYAVPDWIVRQESIGQVDLELLSNPNLIVDRQSESWPSDWPHVVDSEYLEDAGRCYIRLNQAVPHQWTMLYRTVVIQSGMEALRVEVESRVGNLVRGAHTFNEARMILQFKDSNGEVIEPKPRPVVLGQKGTSLWCQRSTAVVVPEGAALLEVMAGHFHSKSGQVDIRLLSVTTTTLAPVLAHAAEKSRRLATSKKAEFEVPIAANAPPELFVRGNRLETVDGVPVWLQGANVPSLEWVPTGDHLLQSIAVLIDSWNVNCIRVPLREDYWLGQDSTQNDGGEAYRFLVDTVVNYCSNRGVYVVLDLHRYRAARMEHVEFWQAVASVYKNHPAVLFDLLNEPHGISWEVWRNGGELPERNTPADEDFFISDEAKRKARMRFESPGMQALLEAIRSTGARNVVIAGGLDWAYDLSGILNGYALDEPQGAQGNGIMYSTHIYPWKSDWQTKFLEVAKMYPIFVGEVGADERVMPWMTRANQESPKSWVPDVLGLIQVQQLHWAAWCFHPSASPRMLEDWTYAPTPFWGQLVLDAMHGKRFELKRQR